MKIEAEVLYPNIRDWGDGFYCWMDPDEQSLLNLASIRQYQSPNLKYHYSTKLHCTIMYHERELPLHPQFPLDGYRAATVARYDIWTVPQGHLLVAVLDSPQLEALHFQFRAAGFIHSYEDYTPHTTLGEYSVMDDRAVSHMELLNRSLPAFKLKYGPQIYADSIGN